MQSMENFLHLTGESEGTLLLNHERACSSVSLKQSVLLPSRIESVP